MFQHLVYIFLSTDLPKIPVAGLGSLVNGTCKQKHVGTGTRNWPYAAVSHSPQAYWPEPPALIEESEHAGFRAVDSAGHPSGPFPTCPTQQHSSLRSVPLCSVPLRPVFPSAPWPRFLCVQLALPFLFVWPWPSHGYCLVNKEYSLGGANEYFLTMKTSLDHETQRPGTSQGKCRTQGSLGCCGKSRALMFS